MLRIYFVLRPILAAPVVARTHPVADPERPALQDAQMVHLVLQACKIQVTQQLVVSRFGGLLNRSFCVFACRRPLATLLL